MWVRSVEPERKVTRAAVTTEGSEIRKSLSDAKIRSKTIRGELAFVIKRDAGNCQVYVASRETWNGQTHRVNCVEPVWMPCTALSEDKALVTAAQIVSRARDLEQYGFLSEALSEAERGLATPHFPFTAELKPMVPAVKAAMKAQEKAESDPDSQSCFGPPQLLDGKG